MLEKIDRLLTMYEENHISRRQLLGALLMASVAAPRAADANQQTSAAPEGNLTGAPPPKDALFHGQLINHVTFSANDIDETRTFYQELIGATVLLDARSSSRAPWYDLQIGTSFVSCMKGREGQPREIGHFAVGLDPWPGAEKALEMVQKRFPQTKPAITQNPVSKAKEVKSVMLKDPNGISVQLGSVTYQL